MLWRVAFRRGEVKAEAELAIQVLKKRCQLEWKSEFDRLDLFEQRWLALDETKVGKLNSDRILCNLTAFFVAFAFADRAESKWQSTHVISLSR